MAQREGCERFASAFGRAYEACPEVPRGVLEAVSFTNTQCHHLTDADYRHDGPEAMPRAYGLMGLVRDGKGYFRENLHLIAQLSGIPEADILDSPEANVLAYAKAFAMLGGKGSTKDCLNAIRELSELPTGERDDDYPMLVMLYSVCEFLNDTAMAERFRFEPFLIDLRSTFGDDYATLSAKGLTIAYGDADYSKAIWNPAPECNYGDRTDAVRGVVIHYTEGSYAGCISWFKNCDAQVSAHYVIRSRDGQVTQMVHESDKAWHARSANAYTIGIEHEAYGDIVSYFTPEMYASSADLVHDISLRYADIDELLAEELGLVLEGIVRQTRWPRGRWLARTTFISGPASAVGNPSISATATSATCVSITYRSLPNRWLQTWPSATWMNCQAKCTMHSLPHTTFRKTT